MRLIFPDGFQIELTTEITYNQYNSIFNALKGEWSYPFQIPGTPEIFAYFNYPQLPQVSTVHQRTYESVSLYEGSFLIGSGTFTIIEATAKMLVTTLNSTAGNIPLKTLNKKLNTLALGGENIGTISKISNYYYVLDWASFNLLDTVVYFGADYFVALEIYADSTLMARSDYTGYTRIGYNPTDADLKKRFIESQNNLSVELGYVKVTKDKIYVKIDKLGYTNITAKFICLPIATNIETNTGGRYPKALSKMTYTTIVDNYYDTKIDNEIYCLPEIQDYSFYSDAKGFSGFINKTESAKIQVNTDADLSRFTIIPQLKFKWVMRKLIEFLGYTGTGNFLANTDIIKMIIFNLYSTDKQAIETSIPFNVHNESIKYANHLPNISILDFLKALIDEFGLGIDFNPLTKIVEFFFFKDILDDAPQIIDINDRVSILPKNKYEEKRHTQVSYTLSGDSLAKEDASPYTSIPTRSVVDASMDTYEKLELKFPPLTTTPQGKIQIEAPGISPLFNQANNESPLRLFFVENQIGKAQTVSLSLDLTKQTGVYQQFIKPRLDFESKTLPLECTALLSLLEITSLSQKTLFLAYNVYWYWDNFSVKLKSGRNLYEVTLRLKRVEK